MARKMGGLGKGLQSIATETAKEANMQELGDQPTILAIDLLHRNEQQPRQFFNEEELQELADSIAQVGVLQPLLVRPDIKGKGFEIIAGERRFQAARRAGLSEVPVIIKEIDDTTSLELALIENIQRSDLNAIEEARTYRQIIDQTGITQEQLAKRLSKSRVSITNSLRLLDLPEPVQHLVFEGKMTAGHARAILAVPSEEMRIKLAQKVADEKLSVRQTESLVALFSVEQADKTPRKVLPSSFKRAARRLREDLATNVKIKQVRRTYKIEIDFTDEEDLARILGMMGEGGTR